MRLLLLFLLSATSLYAQCTGASPTWTSSNDTATLQSCVNGASAGDTINVTAGGGSVTWTVGINVTQAISIVGPGAANLTINDNIPTSASPCNPFHLRPTVIGSLTRISGFTITPGLTTVCPAVNVLGTCSASGCPNVRMDHMIFNGWAGVTRYLNSYGINVFGDVFGVLDHNTVNGTPTKDLDLVEINNANFLDSAQNGYGFNSWALPENYGSFNALYFEDNTFNSASCCETETTAFGSYKLLGGARVVVRFNTYNVSDGVNFTVGWHGTESGGNTYRSPRSFEAYANTTTCTLGSDCGDIIGIRGGTGLVWGNSTIKFSGSPGSAINNYFTMSTYRTQGNPGQWGPCDGSTPYDINDGVTYYSGSILAYNSSTHVITVNGTPNWTTNQWVQAGAPYSVHDLAGGAQYLTSGGEISANTSNTLTFCNFCKGAPGQFSPSVGDNIQILRATSCMDQAGGRGAGFLFTGAGSGGDIRPTPQQSAAEVLSPTYVWANPWSGGSPVFSYVSANTSRIIANRDYYTDNFNQTYNILSGGVYSPFNGTSGTGFGVIANRPTTCTKGVAYWATDQGNWNTNSVVIPGLPTSSQGQLYLCTATNTWTLSYTPGVYPHPLVSGGTGTATLSVTPSGPITCPNALIALYNPAGTTCQNITLQNTGTATLTGLNNTTWLSDTTNWHITGNSCGSSIGPGLTCGFSLVFIPQVQNTYSATLTFTSNATNSPTVVSIGGYGYMPSGPSPSIFAGK